MGTMRDLVLGENEVMEKRVYFKNLSGLRFIAAAAVIFHHVEQYKYWAKLPNAWGNATVDALGAKAVSFFFVLSGFLITYLLMEENRRTSTIRIKDFYVRRVLRIWPVYYLVIVLCLFVVPRVFDLSYLGTMLYDEEFLGKAILLFLVLPNVLRVYSPTLVGGNQLWSIGVEEQFYLIWPLLVRWFMPRLLPFLVIFIVIKLGITAGLLAAVETNDGLLLAAITRFWILLKVEQMAIGAIGAWILFHNRKKLLNMLYHRITLLISAAAVILLFTIPLHHWLINYVEAVVFLLIIINLSTNPEIKFSLENKALTKLGNISYGIYMYHTLCIVTCLYILTYFSVDQHYVLFNLLLYTGSVVLTITVAFFSYEYFEKFFLNLKERFMVVKSGKAQTRRPGSVTPGSN